MADQLTRQDPAERLVELTREASQSIAAAVSHGTPNLTTEIDEALGDYLQDNQARAELIRRTVAGENALRAVLDELISDIAAKQAEKQLQREDRAHAMEVAERRAEAAWEEFQLQQRLRAA